MPVYKLYGRCRAAVFDLGTWGYLIQEMDVLVDYALEGFLALKTVHGW